MKKKLIGIVLISLLLISAIVFWTINHYSFNSSHKIGDKIDSLNGVYVYYNGGVSNVSGRNTTIDNYNLGLKYQCVEFVKRYYYQYLKHKMPDSYGNAKDFFNDTIPDGTLNKQRNLVQFTNPSISKPQVSDLIILDGSTFNSYGHVAIISKVNENDIEIIQQNPGQFTSSRVAYKLKRKSNKWYIDNDRIMGWLRKIKQ